MLPLLACFDFDYLTSNIRRAETPREGAEEGAAGRGLWEGRWMCGVRREPDRGAHRAVRARGCVQRLRQEDAQGDRGIVKWRFNN